MRRAIRGNITPHTRRAGASAVPRAGSGALAVAFVLLTLGAADGHAQERKSIPPQDKSNPLRELISGQYFTPLAMRARQDDDFDNPGYVEWMPKGEKLWGQVEGGQKKSCASCHNQANDSMQGKAASYPKHYQPAGKVVSLEQRINICRKEKMQVQPWAYDSEPMLVMSTYVRAQSRRMPMSIHVDGPAAETFALGKKIYTTRSGQLGMTCAQCHNDRYGSSLRAEVISQGHPTGFPAWSEEGQKPLLLQSRIAECFGFMRAEPIAVDTPEFVALELYLGWRANGLPLDAPAIRR